MLLYVLNVYIIVGCLFVYVLLIYLNILSYVNKLIYCINVYYLICL